MSSQPTSVRNLWSSQRGSSSAEEIDTLMTNVGIMVAGLHDRTRLVATEHYEYRNTGLTVIQKCRLLCKRQDVAMGKATYENELARVRNHTEDRFTDTLRWLLIEDRSNSRTYEVV